MTPSLARSPNPPPLRFWQHPSTPAWMIPILVRLSASSSTLASTREQGQGHLCAYKRLRQRQKAHIRERRLQNEEGEQERRPTRHLSQKEVYPKGYRIQLLSSELLPPQRWQGEAKKHKEKQMKCLFPSGITSLCCWWQVTAGRDGHPPKVTTTSLLALRASSTSQLQDKADEALRAKGYSSNL